MFMPSTVVSLLKLTEIRSSQISLEVDIEAVIEEVGPSITDI